VLLFDFLIIDQCLDNKINKGSKIKRKEIEKISNKKIINQNHKINLNIELSFQETPFARKCSLNFFSRLFNLYSSSSFADSFID